MIKKIYAAIIVMLLFSLFFSTITIGKNIEQNLEENKIIQNNPPYLTDYGYKIISQGLVHTHVAIYMRGVDPDEGELRFRYRTEVEYWTQTLGSYPSGTNYTFDHYYKSKGSFLIEYQCESQNGYSEIYTKYITIPKSRLLNIPIENCIFLTILLSKIERLKSMF